MESNDVKKMMAINFAELKRLIVTDLTKNTRSNKLFKRYKKENIVRYIEDPDKYQLELIELSRFLYNYSSHYARLINYFGNMLLFRYVLEPYGLNMDKKINIRNFNIQHKKNIDIVEKINILDEFSKIMKTVFRDDVFYGYKWESEDSFFIQNLEPKYCKISTIEDGCLNFAYDFSYFDSDVTKLQFFSEEFIFKYKQYKIDSSKRWQELNPKNTICIKFNNTLTYALPPFIGVVADIFDIVDYKALKKAKEEIGNYKILVEEIPYKDKSEEVNNFAIDADTVVEFHNKAVQSLPEGIGMIVSPMKITGISFERDKVDSDGVAQAERDMWNAAGVSQLLFNSEKSGTIGLTNSIKNDEAMAFSVLTQLERWLNRLLKYSTTTYKFKVKMLPITIYNWKEMFENYLKGSQFGLPVKSYACASLGLTPSSIEHMAFLENEVLKIQDKFIPLSSSHTQSEKDSGGQKVNDSDLSDEGMRTRDQNKNANKSS